MTLVLKPGYSFDSDASTYIDAVETADGQALETGVRIAINDFVLGCKQDGIWTAIKASCILAGARTTNGALVPLVGTAPTPNNFDLVGDTDYDRKTGLVGDGSTKYLNTNRPNNGDPQDSKHISFYKSVAPTTTNTKYMGAQDTGIPSLTYLIDNAADLTFGVNRSGGTGSGYTNAQLGFVGTSRSASNLTSFRAASLTTTDANPSNANNTLDIFVYGRNLNGSANSLTDARLSFYSIGESLDLAALDTRVSNLMTAIGAAIP